jgi:nucleoside 2-deoxyribosyltransferase
MVEAQAVLPGGGRIDPKRSANRDHSETRVNQVFISYSRHDRDFVRQLAADLEKRLPQAQVFYDMLIEPGASWAEALSTQIEQADVVLAVLTPDYLESNWTQLELSIALERQLEKSARLIPLLVRPCTPTGFLSELTWVDFTENYESALVRLIWGITGEKPRAAKGEEPGVPTRTLDPGEIDTLRREVQAAVELFKSRAGDASEVQMVQPASPHFDGKRRCFVVMPFGDPDLQVVYEDFVKPTLTDGCDLQCERGDDVFGSNVVMEDVLKSIRAADVILADLTRKNANVFYEVRICHALAKPVLLLAQSIDDVPFDLRHRRVLLYDYSPRGCKRLEGTLRENMRAVLRDL